jgi:nicotinate-nucleotide--dimethylbenzimidazole phosphoribosyltransferase
MSRKGRQGRRSSGGGSSAKRANGSRWGSQVPSTSGTVQSDGASEMESSAEPPPASQPPEVARPAVAAAEPAHEPEPAPAPASASAGLASAPAAAPAVPSEDSSYPPVDLDTDFFASHGSHGSHSSHRGPPFDPLDTDDRDPRYTLKHTPGVALRRKELTKYVKIAVGLSAALCLAALVKVAVAGHGDSPLPRRQTAAQSGAPLPSAVEPEQAKVPEPAASAAPPEPPAPSSAEQHETPPPAASAQESPAPAESAAPASAPTEQPPAATAAAGQPEQPSEPDPAQAAKAKTASRIALERGRLGAAIEAGERAVALDATDGEAWLILGAAYQEKGNAKDARRCYKTCLEQAKRGPRAECAAMLR